MANQSTGATPAGASPALPARDFPWMRVPTERGTRPAIGPDGLLLEHVDVGSYGDVPDVWPYKSDMPRGAYPPPPHVAQTGSYSIYEKVEVWSDNVRRLYEEAIRDRWASAVDIPWQTLRPLPEHLERAVCQVCTELSEQAYLAAQVIAAWFERIAYGFYEVKSFLATQVYDAARHCEAFRKRALANGGGLGIEGPGIFSRVIATCMTFTELTITLNLMRTVWTLSVLEALERRAFSDAERTLYALAARDLRRHLAFGVGHLQFYLRRQPHLAEQVHTWLTRAELFLAADLRKSTPFHEALVLLLGETPAEGLSALAEVRRAAVYRYLHRLADARVVDRLNRLTPEFARYVPAGLTLQPGAQLRPPLPDPDGPSPH